MVNLVRTHWSFLHRVMKIAGVRPYTVEIDPGTVIRFLVPSDIISKPKKSNESPKPKKPVIVLLHGFCGDGIMNWQLQIPALTKKYAVYVPDLLFFGGSFTDKGERSLKIQAECLAAGLRKLGVEKCVLVGFSYGGMVAFKMAELYPDLVHAMFISGAILSITDSIILSVSSCSELLLPNSVEEVRALLSAGTHKKLWFPDRLCNDFLKMMYENRKERGELLDALVISYRHINIPNVQQRIHLFWGENDKIFKVEDAQTLKEKLGDDATFQCIKNAGHLVHIERPCAYNRCLKQFVSSILQGAKK